jgi:hypothetical protein
VDRQGAIEIGPALVSESDNQISTSIYPAVRADCRILGRIGFYTSTRLDPYVGAIPLAPHNGATEEVNAKTRQLSRRAGELLQLQSLQPRRSLPQEQVLEALWPHLDPAAGSANLRKAAHHARHFLGEADALILRGRWYSCFPIATCTATP